MLALGQRDHLDLGAGEVAIRRHQRQVLDARRAGQTTTGGRRPSAAPHRRSRLGALRLRADAARQIALRIDVDQQDLRPASASDVARLMAVVVLPTPPFWLATATMRPAGLGLLLVIQQICVVVDSGCTSNLVLRIRRQASECFT